MNIAFCAREVPGDPVLLNCFTSDTTLPAADSIVDVSCTTVAFSNVVVQGNMTLNISIAGIVAANPSSPNITVTVTNSTVRVGATLAIDSRGYSGAGGGPKKVSIVVRSLVGNDGCLVFLGSFPSGASILVIGARMIAASLRAPTLSTLDLSNPTWHKIVMLVNMSLTGNSTMIFANSSLVANPTSTTFDAFHITGAAQVTTFSNGSGLIFQNCLMSTSSGASVRMWSDMTFSRSSHLAFVSCNMTAGRGHAFYISSTATFSNSSYLDISACTLTARTAGGHAFYMSVGSSTTFTDSSYLALRSSSMTGDGNAFVMGALTLTTCSYLTLSSCTLTGGGNAFLLDSTTTLTESSYLAVSLCNMTAGGAGGGTAFYMYGLAAFSSFSYLVIGTCVLSGRNKAFSVSRMVVDGWSYVIVTNNSFTVAVSNSAPAAVIWFNKPLVIGNSSWVLWKGNVMKSLPGCSSCIQSSINFSSATATPGTISILDNNCTCDAGCAMWATASPVGTVGVGGIIYQRCNTVNTIPVPTEGSALLPSGAISAGPCGSCNAATDCFGPLTVTNSTCSIVAMHTAVCKCKKSGVARSMCLPSSLMLLPAAFSPHTRTATKSPVASLSVLPGTTLSKVFRATRSPRGAQKTAAMVRRFKSRSSTFTSRSVSSYIPAPSSSPPKSVVSSSTQTTAQTATALSVLSSSVAGQGSASDMQAMVIVTLARCAAEPGDGATGGYQLVTPFALWDSARGALAGNALAFGSLLAVQLLALLYTQRVRGQQLEQALASSRLPGYSLMMLASLHQSTLFCSIRLLGSDGVGAGDLLMGLVALLLSLAFPAGCVVASAKIERRFVQCELAGTRFDSMPWKLLVPVGTTLPHETRLMASPVITAFALASPLCVGSQFLSSLLSNFIAVLPASTPWWLCSTAIYVSAVAHVALASAVVLTGMFRFPSSGVLNTCGLVLVGVFHAMIASKFRDKIDAVMIIQSGLSFIRTAAAIGITLLESKMLADGSGVQLARVLWEVRASSEVQQRNSDRDNELSKTLVADDGGDEMLLMLVELGLSDLPVKKKKQQKSNVGFGDDEDDTDATTTTSSSSDETSSALERQLRELQETEKVARPFGIGEDSDDDDLRRMQQQVTQAALSFPAAGDKDNFDL